MELRTHADPLRDIADWAAQRHGEWPEEAYQIAENALVDTVACALAGANQPPIQKLRDLVTNWGSGPCTIIGHELQLASPWAALVNGASAHVLDYDDNFDPAKAHASAVLVPTLLAVGEEEGLSLDALLDAYIVGLQVMGHVGQAVNPFHRNRGWHATATVGVIGAAAGAARLLRLDSKQTGHAISMATSRAGGFMAQFGSDTKPLHAGFAASGAVQSALMARAGLTAGTASLDGPHGMRTLMVGPDVEARAQDMFGTDEHGQSTSFMAGRIAAPLQILSYGLKVKRFPNCGSTHRALDGLLQLREEHGLDAEAVSRVLIRAPASHLRNLPYSDPKSTNEAKFSLEYNLAVALLQGHVGLSDFSPEAIARPEVRALFPKFVKEPVEKLESDFPTEISVRTRSGETFKTQIAMPFGSRQAPLSRGQLFEKFEDCAARTLQPAKAKELRWKFENLDRSSTLVEVVRLLRPA